MAKSAAVLILLGQPHVTKGLGCPVSRQCQSIAILVSMLTILMSSAHTAIAAQRLYLDIAGQGATSTESVSGSLQTGVEGRSASLQQTKSETPMRAQGGCTRNCNDVRQSVIGPDHC